MSGNTFNADNAMSAFNGTPLSYDANSNLTGDGTNTYVWDARNHMSAISGGTTAGFAYDAVGRRAAKSINGTVTQFLYDGLNPVQELDEASPADVTANLLTRLGVDEYFSRTDSGGAMAFIADALGSTVGLVSPAGSIATSYTYEPFGNMAASGQSNANTYQFTGRENDGSGLYFYRARYYSPTFQRFIAQDPIEFQRGGTNLYDYVLNNPANFRDESGKGPIAAGLVGAACVGYTVFQYVRYGSEIDQLTQEHARIGQKINRLTQERNECHDMTRQFELQKQIDELELKLAQLAKDLAAAHVLYPLMDVMNGAACAVAIRIAWALPW